jgi:hypothetical protein
MAIDWISLLGKWQRVAGVCAGYVAFLLLGNHRLPCGKLSLGGLAQLRG